MVGNEGGRRSSSFVLLLLVVVVVVVVLFVDFADGIKTNVGILLFVHLWKYMLDKKIHGFSFPSFRFFQPEK
jgi:hypothetical protein